MATTTGVPDQLRPLRDRVLAFVEERVYPAEAVLARDDDDARDRLRELQGEARDAGLWALGHPTELGGGGLPFLDYVHVNEVQGRSAFGQLALGSFTLQDALMLQRHGSEEQRRRFLEPLVRAEVYPSFAMTEPDVAGSDPTQLATTARRDGDHWVLRGRKWFTTFADRAAFTTVMCRTEEDAPPHASFSLVVVPTDTPGYRIVRETPVLGLHDGHCEVELDDVRVPVDHLLGERGAGFRIAQERLGPGRIFHVMRWLGQAQRAFDLMCRRLHERHAFGGPLADKQLLQRYVFDAYAEIRSCRLLTLDAAARIDRGDDARTEIGALKVVAAGMLHRVIDRAIQVHGAAGLTPDTPLDVMYRHARAARIYDGPDEVHVQSVARRVLRAYADDGPGLDLGAV
jgi:acyl-CoA dehydrogenase